MFAHVTIKIIHYRANNIYIYVYVIYAHDIMSEALRQINQTFLFSC